MPCLAKLVVLCTDSEVRGSRHANTSPIQYWRTKAHPDPLGETCALLSSVLRSQWPSFQQHGISDIGVFLDWCSCWQWPRSETQERIFKQSLRSINLWYAHKLTTVYLVTGGEADGLTYHNKGWTSFEYLLSMLTKVSNTSELKDWPMVLDLGQSDPAEDLRRLPPAEPLAFMAGHSYGARVYTNGADRDDIVAPKFKQTIVEVMYGVRELNFNTANWGNAGARKLAAVLPLCQSLEKLLLEWNGIGDEGAISIAHALKNVTAPLRTLVLSNNPIEQAGRAALQDAKQCYESATLTIVL